MQRTIYKKDSSGKIRYLTISTESNIIVQESGVIGTPNPIYNRSTCEPKNVGRSNATTGPEQAVFEAQSKVTEKLRLGYFDTIAEAQEKGGGDFLLPMLAKDFGKEMKKVVYPCLAQPKLDGMRALGSEENTMMSRTGKFIDTITHIKFPPVLGDTVLDGELYAHGISFQENMKLIKKYSAGKTELIQYHVYDLILDAPFHVRHHLLKELVAGVPNIVLVETLVINNYKELTDFHQRNIAAGYEGTMVRHSQEGYAVNKRSSQLLKLKDFIDEVYEVVDVEPSESRPEQGVVVCKGTDNTGHGFTFGCGMKFSHADREEILRNKQNYIGKKAEIRFFEFTDDGIPRFPVCYGFREDK